MSILKKLELRPATGDDFKVASNKWKIGQPYCIGREDSDHVKGIFTINGDEDPFVFKMFLAKELLFIPLNEPFLGEFIKKEKEDDI